MRYETTGTSSATLTVSTTASAMVLVRTPFDPGWRATVDGRPAPVLPADFLDQAVPVPPGRHTVVLAYRDPWIAVGLAGTAVAVAALVCLIAAAARRDRRLEPAQPSVMS